MSDDAILAYRAQVLRTARIRMGKRVKLSGAPAILAASAALAFAACTGTALVLLACAAIVAAGRLRPAAETSPELGPMLRGERPGLPP